MRPKAEAEGERTRNRDWLNGSRSGSKASLEKAQMRVEKEGAQNCNFVGPVLSVERHF